MDLNPETVSRAARRYPSPPLRFLACDARQPALRPASLDLIVSTSTLDHMETAEDLHARLRALAGLLRPGGLLIITMDNLENPLYRPLRWASRRGWLPFRMGYTVSRAGLQRALETCGFQVLATERLLHNPRMLSTLLFLGLRRVLGQRADTPVAWLLRGFALLGKTPLRRWTACFVAACARLEDAAGSA
jgi:SAM-dependent methyltransferase